MDDRVFEGHGAVSGQDLYVDRKRWVLYFSFPVTAAFVPLFVRIDHSSSRTTGRVEVFLRVSQ